MKPLDDRQLERLLTPLDDPQPPTDLLARIQSEIPAHVGADDSVGDGPTVPASPASRRWLPIAATVLMALGAATLAWRVREDVDPRVDRIIDESVAAVRSESTPAIPPPDEPAADEPVAPPLAALVPPALVPLAPAPAGGPQTGQAAPAARALPAERAMAEGEPSSSGDPSSILGNLYGQVADSTGSPIPGATLEVGQGATKRRLLTDQEGRFRALSLPADQYRVVSILEGFSTVEYPAVSVRGGRNTSIEVTMSPSIEETITVSTEAPLLDGRQTVNDLRQSPSARSPQNLESARIRSRVADSSSPQDSPGEAAPASPRPTASAVSQESSSENRLRRSLEALPRGVQGSTKGSPGLASKRRLLVPQPASRALPNQAPYDATYFKDYGTNPFVDTVDDALSTFALDVDTASYNVVRRFLRDGHRPDPASVRVEELINAFDYRDAPPETGDFAVHIEAAPSPFGEGGRYHLVRFALKAREIDDRARPPVDLILVVDTSGSMAREDRLGLVKTATRMLLGQLGSRDRVGLVAYNEDARIALLPTRDLREVEQCLLHLQAAGSTNAAAGLRLGYRLAADYRRADATSRVMLLSDGVANVGNTSAGGILDEVAHHAAAGVELTTVGVGMGNFNDVLLEQLADRGDGRYAYVDDRAEAHRIFVETLTGTLTTIASEAKVQVAFDPEIVARYRLIGYENRALADRDFRDDRVDAGEVGSGHTVVALYEVKLTDAVPRGALATLHLRYRSHSRDRVIEERHAVRREHLANRFRQASPAFRLTALVAEAGEILGESYWARGSDLRQVLRETEAVRSAFGRDERVRDWVHLLERATHLLPGGFADD